MTVGLDPRPQTLHPRMRGFKRTERLALLCWATDPHPRFVSLAEWLVLAPLRRVAPALQFSYINH